MRKVFALLFGLFVSLFVGASAGPETGADVLLSFAAGWIVFALFLPEE